MPKNIQKKTSSSNFIKKTSDATTKSINSNTINLQKSQKDNTGQNLDRMLVENFVSLQRVMTNLSLKFDNLSTQISKLLELFEISAKTIVEKYPNSKTEAKSGREIAGKLDNLLEQNKIIARGLMFLHESPQLSSKERFGQPMPPQQRQNPPLPQERKTSNAPEEYHKSLSPKQDDERKF